LASFEIDYTGIHGQQNIKNQMPFTTIRRRYFKHDDITAFILQVLYKSLVIELPLAVYGCETWSLTARKEKRLCL